MHVGYLSKNKSKYKIIVPRWRFECFLQNYIRSLRKNAKVSHNIAIQDYTMTHAHPFTSKDKASYQINGKIEISNERKKWTKTFE